MAYAVLLTAEALFGISGPIKSVQPAMLGSDGLLCFIVPRLGGLMP